MLGKNRGKTLPSRKRKPKWTQDDASLLSESIEESSSTTTTTSHHPLPVTVPRKFGSDLSAIQFASAVDPKVVEVVLRCRLYLLSVAFVQKQLTTRLQSPPLPSSSSFPWSHVSSLREGPRHGLRL